MSRTMQINHSRDNYVLRHDWPENCFVQGGRNGTVFTSKNVLSDALNGDVAKTKSILETALGGSNKEAHYRTAYFEAFPEGENSTFIRGEGPTLEDAEDAAWKKWERISACSHPAFERRNYRNGLGFCTECGMSRSNAFEPLEKCSVCGIATYYSERRGEWRCKDHAGPRPYYHDEEK